MATDSGARASVLREKSEIAQELQGLLDTREKIVSFLSGGVLPLLAITLLAAVIRIPATVAVVVLALALTGAIGARLGGAHPLRPTLRTVVGGGLALLLTFLIGHLLGTSGVA